MRDPHGPIHALFDQHMGAPDIGLRLIELPVVAGVPLPGPGLVSIMMMSQWVDADMGGSRGKGHSLRRRRPLGSRYCAVLHSEGFFLRRGLPT